MKKLVIAGLLLFAVVGAGMYALDRSNQASKAKLFEQMVIEQQRKAAQTTGAAGGSGEENSCEQACDTKPAAACEGLEGAVALHCKRVAANDQRSCRMQCMMGPRQGAEQFGKSGSFRP